MSDIWIPYGGGADLDPVTATAADVRRGKTIVDRDGNPISGTMPDIAGRTITPGASQQTVNGGGYLTGNITVPGFSLPAANTIKKGVTVTIYGRKVIGTFQGWVGDAGDLYINGQNNAGFTLYNASFQQDRITFGSGTPSITSTKAYTLTEGQKLYVAGENISGSFGAGQSGKAWLELRDSDGTSTGTTITQIEWSGSSMRSGFSFTMPRSLTFKPIIKFAYATNGWSGCIKRIYI